MFPPDSPELLALAAALFGAVAQIAAKRAVVLSSPALYLAYRWLITATLFTLLVTALGGWAEFRPRVDWLYPLAGALIGPFLAWNLYTRSLTRLDVSVAFPLTQTSSLGSGLLAWLFLDEQPDLAAALGAVLIILGASLLYGRPRGGRGQRFSRTGLVLAIGASACWSFAYLFWKWSSLYVGLHEVNWLRAVLPAVIMGLALVDNRSKTAETGRVSMSGRALLFAALSAIFADVLSFGCQFLALRGGRIGTVVPIVNSSPLFLVGLSALLLGERVSRVGLLGVAIIVLGVWCVAGFRPG